MGHVIANDPLYNHCVWGKQKGKGGIDEISTKSIIDSLIKEGISQEECLISNLPTTMEQNADVTTTSDVINEESQNSKNIKSLGKCEECTMPNFPDPERQE